MWLLGFFPNFLNSEITGKCYDNVTSFIDAGGSHLMFLLPQVVQSNALHYTVVTKLAAEHLPQQVDEVHVMLCAHRVVMVEVQEHDLNQSDVTFNQLIIQNSPWSWLYVLFISFINTCTYILKVLPTSFLCLLRKELISSRPSLTFREKKKHLFKARLFW